MTLPGMHLVGVGFGSTNFFASGAAQPLFDHFAQAAIERVINSLPEGILIALFAWAVLRVLPRQNSRTRFAVWFATLLAVVALPVVEGLGLDRLNWIGVTARKIFGEGIFGPHIFDGAVASNHAASTLALPAHWAPIIFVLWLLAAGVAIGRLGAAVWHVRNLRRNCTPVDTATLDPVLRETMESLNAARSVGARRVTLATSDRVRVPAALGLGKPMIVLPAWTLGEMPASDLSIIVQHEFAHLRRWDDWTNLVQKLARAAFFFHPAVWWIEGRLSVEREMACDDVVLAQCGNAAGYASCLVTLLERSLAQRGWMMAQAIVHRAREASMRLTRILDKNRPVETRLSKPALGLVGTFALLCIVMLPQTPKFVAFDRPAVDEGGAIALSQRAGLRNAEARESLRGAAVIPAGLKYEARATSAAAEVGVAEVGVAEVGTAEVAATRKSAVFAPARNVSGRGETDVKDAWREFAIEAANSDRNSAPAATEIEIIRQAQFVTAEFPVAQLTVVNSPDGPAMVWRVQMMRVTFVEPVWVQRVREAAPKKI